MKVINLIPVLALIGLIFFQPVAIADSAAGLVAKKALVNAAQDNSYSDFMLADINERHAHRDRVDKVSLTHLSKNQTRSP